MVVVTALVAEAAGAGSPTSSANKNPFAKARGFLFAEETEIPERRVTIKNYSDTLPYIARAAFTLYAQYLSPYDQCHHSVG